jgi:AcrR family transcriptional regulator
MDTSRASITIATRNRIVHAAAALLAQGGLEAISTRSVADAAAVQVPTIYRLFGDMRSLMNAVVSYEFEVYLESKHAQTQNEDPVEAIRQGWDSHVEFGLANPALYTLMYSEARPGGEFTAAVKAMQMLCELVKRIAEAGRLQLGVEQSAQMLHAACRGVTFSLLEMQPEARDLTLSTLVREAILSAITLPTDNSMVATPPQRAQDSQSRIISRAVALKAVLPELIMLTPGERSLLIEWLDRLSQPHPLAATKGLLAPVTR